MAQLSHPFLRSSLLGALLILLGSLTASAQWVVYDMRMQADEEVSVNFVHYSGAYVIAPLNGGSASLVFTTEEAGARYFAVAENAARYFVAANAVKQRAVISAVANVGSSQSLYQASGSLNSTLTYQFNGQSHTASVASALSGQLMTSDDEHLASGPASDGSLGVFGLASFKGFFRKDLADKVDAEAPTMPQAIAIIAGLLQKYGYQPEVDADQVSVPAKVTDPPPIPQSPDTADGSLFPPGSRDEMAKSLLQQPTK